MLLAIDRAFEGITLLLKYFAAALLLAVALLITLDVTMRFFFNQPIIGIAEIVSNGIVIIAFLQLGYSVRIRSMLRSDFLLSRLGLGGKITVEVVTCMLSILFFGLIAWASWSPMMRSIEIGEFIGHASFQMPTWPLRVTIVGCSLLAIANYALLALRALILRDTGENDEAAQAVV